MNLQDDVVAKGKGVLKMFWLVPSLKKAKSATLSESGMTHPDDAPCE